MVTRKNTTREESRGEVRRDRGDHRVFLIFLCELCDLCERFSSSSLIPAQPGQGLAELGDYEIRKIESFPYQSK